MVVAPRCLGILVGLVGVVIIDGVKENQQPIFLFSF